MHFGVILIVIGFAGLPFNQDKEQEMGFGDRMQIGGYTLVCQSYTQDDKPNYGSEWAVLDVYKNGRKIDTMFPERRFYKASEQTATIVANRSRLNEDLYLVYTGQNPDTGRPIIKAHVNPLVMWIWIGVHIVLIGTILALIPNWKPPKARSAEKEREGSRAALSRGAVEVGGTDAAQTKSPPYNSITRHCLTRRRIYGRRRRCPLQQARTSAHVHVRLQPDPAGMQPRRLRLLGTYARRIDDGAGARRQRFACTAKLRAEVRQHRVGGAHVERLQCSRVDHAFRGICGSHRADGVAGTAVEGASRGSSCGPTQLGSEQLDELRKRARQETEF